MTPWVLLCALQVQYGMPLAPPPASPLQPNQWQPAGAGYGEYLPQGAAPAMDFTPGKHVAQGMMRPSNGSDGSEVHACPAGAAAPTPTKHIATPLAGHAAAGGSFSSSNSKQHVAQQLPAAGGDHLDAPAYGAWQQPAGAPATAYAPPSAPAAYAPVSAWGAQPTLDLHQDAQDEDGLPPMGGFDAHSPASKCVRACAGGGWRCTRVCVGGLAHDAPHPVCALPGTPTLPGRSRRGAYERLYVRANAIRMRVQ